MQLRNPFPPEVKLLYLGCWRCWLCGANGQTKGGLDIHHIMGRISNSAFNSSCLCRECHNNVLHTKEVESKLFLITLVYLQDVGYVPVQKDWDFFRENYQRLHSPELEEWLKKNH